MRHGRLVAMAAVLVAAASVCTAAGPGPLEVPFVPQGEDLCGGAAAAMVLRYWGARDVGADTFAPLVDRSAGGIKTASLVGDLRARGWTVVAGASDLAGLGRELDRGRPVITLIEVRPGRFHYVVVIGLTTAEVVIHDPARGPSRVMSTQAFASAWSKSNRWMLILLPGAGSPEKRDSDFSSRKKGAVPFLGESDPRGPGACQVDAAVARANDGDYAAARRALEDATVACAGDAAPWRELAGLDAVESKWSAAAAHARLAVEIDRADAHAWRILATAEYLQHHDLAALDAWNQIGEPAIDLIDVRGLRSTRYAVVADAMGVATGGMLTRDALRLAERRARAVPAIAIARVTFHPIENGRAQVDAAVVERDRAPTKYTSWIGIGLDAAANREVSTSFANPSGGGDLIGLTWRWWPHRPLIAASYSAPAPRALGGGTWRVDASRETQTFSPGELEETHTRASFGVADWLTARTRVAGSAGIESWSDRGRTPSLSGRVEFWPVTDRLSLDASATHWIGADSFNAASGAIRWKSSPATTGFVWLAASGYQFATDRAPASVWPGADTGHARDVLLRAHPLLEDGVIVAATPASSGATGVLGRRLAFGSVEAQRWQTVGEWPVRMAPAAFVDVARAVHGFGGASTPSHIDAGVGLRVSLLGLGALRVDVAHGLRDGQNALSIGFVR